MWKEDIYICYFFDGNCLRYEFFKFLENLLFLLFVIIGELLLIFFVVKD